MSDTTATQTTRTATPTRLFLARYAMVGLLIALSVVYSIIEPDTFFSFATFRAILSTQAVLGIIAVAMVIPLVVGEFDLSAPVNLGLAGIVVTGLMSHHGQHMAVAIVAAVVVSTFIGVINGLLVTRVGINSLITTLGMSTLITGIMYAYTDGRHIVTGIPESFLTIARTEVLGLPMTAFYLAIIAIVVWYMLDQTPLGRYMYAIGGGKDAARLAGIRTRLLTMFAFVLTGFLPGLAGVIMAARIGTGDPTRGPNFLLAAFAAAFLGAAAIKPGTFNVGGTIVAIFTLAVGVTGLQLKGVPFWIEPIFNGLALIVALTLTRYLRRETL